MPTPDDLIHKFAGSDIGHESSFSSVIISYQLSSVIMIFEE